MSQDAIKQVTQVEREAAEKLASAQTQVKKIISDAKEEGARLAEQSRISAEAQAKNLMMEAELEAAKNSAAIIEETGRECDQLRALAEGRMDDAVAMIVGRVVST